MRQHQTEIRSETLEGRPFLVANGSQFEIHDYGYDADGRRWEITLSEAFDNELDCQSALERMKEAHWTERP